MNLQALRAWRGVETPCPKCGGSGVWNYPSGSTWRGGPSAACIRRDVCDACWGSGDAHEKWTDLRAWRDEEQAKIDREAGKLLARRLGADLASIRPAILELCKVLDREARRRKPPTGEDFWGQRNWEIVCHGLAGALRAMVAEREAKS